MHGLGERSSRGIWGERKFVGALGVPQGAGCDRLGVHGWRLTSCSKSEEPGKKSRARAGLVLGEGLTGHTYCVSGPAER